MAVKVLHVIASLEGGGTERSLVNFLKHSQGRIKNYVCCINKGGVYENTLKELNVDYIILKRRCKFDLSLIWQIRQFMKTLNVDIVQTYNFTGNFWGRIAARKFSGIKTVSYERGTVWGNSPLLNRFEKYLSRTTDRILANSQAAAKMLCFRSGISCRRISVINNGIERFPLLNEEEKRSLRESLSLDPGALVLGYVGRMVSLKGVDIIIRALETVKKSFPLIKLVLVGKGKELDNYRFMVRKSGLEKNVSFTGFRSDARRIMQVFDIILLPSIKESFPNTVLEAMYAKVPVIGSNVDGICEILSDGETGCLIEPTVPARGRDLPAYHYNGALDKIERTKAVDPKILADKIITLLNNKDRLATYSENAHNTVTEKYSIDGYVSTLEDLYLELLR